MRCLSALLLLLSTTVYAQEPFPQLTGETADGRQVTLPLTDAKRHTIIGIAYGKAAGPVIEEWYEPAYLRFVAQHGLFAGAYDADVYFVPLFVGANKAAYEPSIRKFRKSASPEIIDHVLFAKGDLETLQGALGLNDKDVPYFFVLDAAGNIVHRERGAFTDDKLEGIEDVLLR